MKRIGFDAMGGDHAPVETVKGAIEALNLVDAKIVLYGDEALINTELAKYGPRSERIEVVHAPDRIENDDKPVAAIRHKPEASMVVGLVALKNKEIDAFVSAGNTGALLAGGLFKVGRIKGITRPAICTIYPTSDRPSVLIDAGANAEVKPRNLIDFALMGAVYAERVIGLDKPTIGLVNVGAEETKGTPLHIETHQIMKRLKSDDFRFVGNLEGRDVPYGKADVIVADGFTGNIILKLTEGVAGVLLEHVKSAIMSSLVSKIGGLLIKKSMKQLKKRLDYTEYGGAPILGVEGLLVKAHGSSNAKAFSNAIKYANLGAERNIVELIKRRLNEFDFSTVTTESKREGAGDEVE